jgi:NAD(P)H-dependent FMN reductase
MVLADTEDIETNLVGQFDFFHQVAEAFGRSHSRSHFGERVDAQFHATSFPRNIARPRYARETVTTVSAAQSGATMSRLGVVLTSTREGRIGAPVTEWFLDRARAHAGFEVEFIDLKAVNLPMLSEPNHPRLRKYTQATTQAWSATVESLDALVFVSPEYNYGTPPALVNALDHLYAEWNYKAAGLVTYGGISGGLRAGQMTKLLLTSFKVVPIVEAVTIPFVAKHVANGVFVAEEAHDKSAIVMLDELVRWTAALSGLRAR